MQNLTTNNECNYLTFQYLTPMQLLAFELVLALALDLVEQVFKITYLIKVTALTRVV